MRKASYDLQKWIYSLLDDEPVFAAISRIIEKTVDNNMPTAYVTANAFGGIRMGYNEEFFSSLTRKQRKGIVKHELLHVMLGHISGARLPEKDTPRRRAWNIATDLAINSMIPRDQLPKDALYPGEEMFKDFPPLKSAEWYLAEVIKMAKKMRDEGKGGSGPGGILDAEPGNHEEWDNGQDGQQDKDSSGAGGKGGEDSESSVGSKIAEERIKEALRKAVNAANKSADGKMWGSLPAEAQQVLRARVETVVDWRKVLRFFVGQMQRGEKSTTVRRLNKRYPYILPGTKINRLANIAVAMDQSGSVSNNLLEVFFAELAKLSNYVTFTLIPFDTEVDDSLVVEWKKGKSLPTVRTKVGGTDFDAPTKWVNENSKFDGLIILTDMAAPKPVKCKRHRLWVTTKEEYESSYAHHPEREKVIFVTEPKNNP